jgi:hypothetical protein
MSIQNKNGAVFTSIERQPAVVFQLWSDDTGVFFKKETYARFRLIELAIKKAKTWQDLEKLLPDGEFKNFSFWWVNGGEWVYEDLEDLRFIDSKDLAEFWKLCGEGRLVRSEDEYDPNLLGVSEGDYPAWLNDTADEILPKEFIKRFGKGVASMVSGYWIEYQLSDLMEMVENLGSHGFSVTAHLSYDFSWWRQIDLAS